MKNRKEIVINLIIAVLILCFCFCTELFFNRKVIGKNNISKVKVIEKHGIETDGKWLKTTSKNAYIILKIEDIKEEITSYRMEGDSIGGIVECAIVGLEAGIGNPFFDSLESTIAHLAFSVPAVKGIEFGAGFDFANMKGSESNDEYFIEDEKVKTYSNNNGGITGGISNGMPVIFRVVIKPTPSISKEQRTINIKNMTEEVLSVNGRHDPCIVQRALVVIEAIAAISILELIK